VTQLALSEAVPLAHALVDRVARDSDVRVLFIKGPAAVEQGLRGRRTSVDVDALVDPARRRVLGEALAAHGWVDDNPRRTPTILPRHSLTLQRPTWACELDLHDHFPGFFADHQDVFERLWERRTRVEIAGREVAAPDLLGHALVLALHCLRDPHDAAKQADLDELVEDLRARLDADALREVAELARDLGASDTAEPFLSRVGAPAVGRGATSAQDLRTWRLRTEPARTTTISWVAELGRQPLRHWPRYLWYAAFLSEEELRLAEPDLAAGSRAVWGARARRLRRGLSAMPAAVASVRRSDAPARTTRPQAVVVQEILTAYRVPFFERLRARLDEEGVDLTLVSGRAAGDRAARADRGSLDWTVPTQNKHLPLLPGKRALVWQPLPRSVVRRADVVVVEQANRLLLNYRLLLRSAVRHRPRVVYWGHGGDLQASGPLTAVWDGVKQWASRRAYWWLAYTEGSADRVAALGFPRERITVVQNAVEVRVPESAPARVPGRCVYVGSLYSHKRIGYLLDAARRAAELCDDFRLVVIGDGEDRPLVDDRAAEEPWLDVRGPVFGDEAAAVLASSNLLLMPGLVGLAVVDAFATGCPLVTVDLPFHSPEIEYLEDGVNGVLLPAGTAPEQYGEEVARLLADPARLQRLRDGCAVAATTYTLDAMVDRYAAGLLAALR
jgi:glycosyltransferase involved in cell wall biosynthesis